MGSRFLYGVCGSTNLEVREGVAARQRGRAPEGIAAAVDGASSSPGLSFRITAVPFHFYAPDVFAGTSLPMAAFLSFVPKIAGFVALFRLVAGVMLAPPETLPAGSGPPSLELATMLGILATATMFAGNMIALVQTDVRRLLAYSGVAHGGYMLLALSVGQPSRTGRSGGPGGALLLDGVRGDDDRRLRGAQRRFLAGRSPIETLDDLRGLSTQRPVLGGGDGALSLQPDRLAADCGNDGQAADSACALVEELVDVLVPRSVACGQRGDQRGLLHPPVARGLFRDVRTRSPPRPTWRAAVVVAICAALTLGLFFFPGLVMRRIATSVLTERAAAQWVAPQSLFRILNNANRSAPSLGVALGRITDESRETSSMISFLASLCVAVGSAGAARPERRFLQARQRPSGGAAPRSHDAASLGGGGLSRRRQERTSRPHRIRPLLRTHDVPRHAARSELRHPACRKPACRRTRSRRKT